MNNIRPANIADTGRIAEIIVTNYRVNFYPFFLNDEFYFKEMNVLDIASEYAADPVLSENTYVYDDGIIKGVLRLDGDEIKKLFVEPQFQSMGAGTNLLRFAVDEKKTFRLWVLDYNKRAQAFYIRNGFEFTGGKMIEDDWEPLSEMVCRR